MESPLKPLKKPSKREEQGAVLPTREKFATALKIYYELYGGADNVVSRVHEPSVQE